MVFSLYTFIYLKLYVIIVVDWRIHARGFFTRTSEKHERLEQLCSKQMCKKSTRADILNSLWLLNIATLEK